MTTTFVYSYVYTILGDEQACPLRILISAPNLPRGSSWRLSELSVRVGLLAVIGFANLRGLS